MVWRSRHDAFDSTFTLLCRRCVPKRCRILLLIRRLKLLRLLLLHHFSIAPPPLRNNDDVVCVRVGSEDHNRTAHLFVVTDTIGKCVLLRIPKVADEGQRIPVTQLT